MIRLPLILIGGGGHCKSVIEAAESDRHIIAGILEKEVGDDRHVLGYPIKGTDGDIPSYTTGHNFVITVGHIKSPAIRQRIARDIENAGGKAAIIIASSAIVSRHADIKDGTVVLHNATVNAGAHIGRHCIINTGAIIEHEAKVGDFCHISTGAVINGQCNIGEGTFIGSGTIVAHCITIAPGCVIGAGSVVVSDITEPGTYYGNPARKHS